jgi:hypothetical protein
MFMKANGRYDCTVVGAPLRAMSGRSSDGEVDAHIVRVL